ncbi:hypothetical protein SAMN05216302_100372 [Nitrosomonas aestuarii]|uniref:Uncharacterized protein n=1 Tax=Nitrosomonas aestuarii TaxID=52441 RepID=A0A1I3Y8A7_9PROT|nr:hypothetical protein SAMN05216302_100372 [Nitrosomonas aestuarii]
MDNAWSQFVCSKVERESVLIKQRIIWLFLSQAVFFTVFFILLGSEHASQPDLELNTIQKSAFLLPVIGIMISMSVLISNLGAYVNLYQVSSLLCTSLLCICLNSNKDRSPVFKGKFSSVLGLIASTGVTLAILILWAAILFFMTCDYQFPSFHLRNLHI